MGKACFGRSAQQVDDRRIQLALLRQPLVQIPSIRRGVGSLPYHKQVAGFLKVGVVGQFVNVDAAIGQNALLAVDIANAGVGGDYSFQTFRGVRGGQAGHVPSLEILESSLMAHGKEKCRVLSQLTFIRQKS